MVIMGRSQCLKPSIGLLLGRGESGTGARQWNQWLGKFNWPELCNRAEWRSLLARYSRSELTVAGFCQAEGICPASLYRWQALLGDQVLRLLVLVS